VLAVFGPAFIASVAYVDPGNFATNVSAGAKYGTADSSERRNTGRLERVC